MRKTTLFICWIFFFPTSSFAQINWSNPSFEGTPKDATNVPDWDNCKEGSTPDILPGPWEITLKPKDGNTFLGLITREDGSWESLSQKLSEPIKKGNCYYFKVDLAHSPTYMNYNLPVRLRVWGSSGGCEFEELLASTELITHQDWRTYDLVFRAKKKDYTNIILEVYYGKGILMDYRGNILIDNLQSINHCKRASLD